MESAASELRLKKLAAIWSILKLQKRFCYMRKHTRFFCFDFNTLRTKAGLPFMIVKSGDGEWVAAPDYENETIRARAGPPPPTPLPVPIQVQGRKGAPPLQGDPVPRGKTPTPAARREAPPNPRGRTPTSLPPRPRKRESQSVW